MRLKKDYIIRHIAGLDVVVPIGQGISDFNGIITLNSSASFLWNIMQQDTTEEALKLALQKEYAIEEAVAEMDVKEFIKTLKDHNICEDA